MKNRHTFIDLFSGCGGLSLGFEMAGFTGVLAIDNWKDALTTYAITEKTQELFVETWQRLTHIK